MIDPSIIKRFMAKVRKEGECWRWIGYRDKRGYGQFRISGFIEWSHRVSFRIFKGGRIKDDMDIHHECHHTWCVNPDHLTERGRSWNRKEANYRKKNGALNQPLPLPPDIEGVPF